MHTIENHLLLSAQQEPSPFCDERTVEEDISLLVIHNISLPPNQFGGPYISQLFQGCLDPKEHPYFDEIKGLEVSSHLLIRRDGELIQYVPFNKRAWHAGVSSFDGREKCNDFSIGIELEGADDIPFTNKQYEALASVTQVIMSHYPLITADRVTGHSDIAPGRKTDPGEYFYWQRFQQLVSR